MISIKQTVLNAAVASALGLGAVGAAHAAAITSITITDGSFTLGGPRIQFGCDNFQPVCTSPKVPIVIGANTDLVSGYLGSGGVTIGTTDQDPNTIAGFRFFGGPVNIYTAATNLGDSETVAGSITGGPVPTGDISGGVMTLDLSSWFANWNGTDFNQGSATASTDFVPILDVGAEYADAPGSVSCVGTSCTFTNLEWQSLIVGGPFDQQTGAWTLSGTATIEATPQVPVPAAVWLFGSGLLGLVGVARRRMK